jgi:hypothetical protein
VSAASEALALQELIGYTEGIVSALHVLGQASRLHGDLDEARVHHRRALTLASRIGHAAAMCEAVEDLARDEAVDRPDLTAIMLQAARTERARRGLPLRQRDAEELAVLERTVTDENAAAPMNASFNDLVSEMTK